jgi:hypothetical protein
MAQGAPGGDGAVSQEELRAEVARRRLLLLPPGEVPVAELTRQLGDAVSEMVWRAASVLVHHGMASEETAALLDHDSKRISDLALGSADEAQLVERLQRPGVDPERRRGILWALEDLRGLTDGELVAALGDSERIVREAAQAVVLYERVPITPEFLQLVQESVPARDSILAGLARKQRRDCDSWLRALWESASLGLVERLHIIAALPDDQLTPAMARIVLDVAGTREHEVSDAAYRAAANLSARLADGLIGEVHRRCGQGASVEEFLPLLVKTSANGQRHLLAVASNLGREACESICVWLVGRGSPGLQERVRAALDGEIPLEIHLLARAADHLDRPERVRRVVARLREGDEAEKLKAFDALVRGEVYDEAMLEYALELEGFFSPRVRQLSGLPAGRLPDEALLQLLSSDVTRNVMYACQAAAKRPMAAEVENVVLDLAAGSNPDELRAAATRALMLSGTETRVRELWPHLRESPDLQINAVTWLTERGDPWVQVLFLEELATVVDAAPAAGSGGNGRGDVSVSLFLQMALARMGDRHLFNELISSAGKRSAWYLRQSRSFAVPRMTTEHAGLIAEQLRFVEMPEAVRIELVSWLGMRPDLDVHEALEQVVRSDASEWVRMEAQRGLLAGPRRAAKQAELFAVMDRPLDDRHKELAYEIMGSAEAPLTAGDVELMARLMVQLPLSRPEQEARSDLSFHSSRAGFPMGILAVQQLRRDPQGRPGGIFAEVVDEVLADEQVGLLSRGRCLALLRQAVLDSRVRTELGPPLARLLLEIPEAVGHGPAHLLLGEEAEAVADLASALEHYTQAIRIVLRDPDPQNTLRVFLGDRDPVRDQHPVAALAARSRIIAATVAMAEADRATARRQLALASELAAGDRETEQEIQRLQEELNR